jgi:predicted DNA-binding transcriptional regulator AlpA
VATSNSTADRLLKPNETAEFLRLSQSWLAKSRMSGKGPPFIRIGRAIRYSQTALLQWMKSMKYFTEFIEHLIENTLATAAVTF